MTGDEGVTISTILGSCVAACLYDPVAGIGGMNHIVLPLAPDDQEVLDTSYGDHAMYATMEDMLKMGARPERMVARVFGGANMFGSTGYIGTIGKRNVKTAVDFIRGHGITIRGGNVGGSYSRKVDFSPSEGRVRLRLMGDMMSRTPVESRQFEAPARAVPRGPSTPRF